MSLSWPLSAADVIVEQSAMLGIGAQWTVVTNVPVIGPDNVSVILPVLGGNQFFRLRQPW
jgi:hypothetical protein